MILEAVALAGISRPKTKHTIIVIALLVINDLFDYLLGTVTQVPPEYLSFLFAESVLASIAIPLIAWFSRRAGA